MLLRYWEYAKGYYRKNGEPTREISALKSALRPVRELYGSHPAREFGPLALETVRQRMIALGWSRTGINRAISRVRRVFRWGVSKELISPGISQALATIEGLRKGRTEATEKPPVEPVSDTAVEATIEHLFSIVADMVRLQRLTGMRPGDPSLIDDGLFFVDGRAAVNPLRSAFEDVNDDGFVDLTLKFSITDLLAYQALGSDTMEGLLTGELLNGTSFAGMDSIRIVPPNRSNGHHLQISNVPEPTTCTLALAALCLAMSRRRAF